MPCAFSDRIHPTAIISADAVLADDVRVGPYAVIEGPVRLGAGCVVGAHACLYGPVSMGERNQVFSGAILGEEPQHLKYGGEITSVEIGDDNIFRENVTIHRATSHSWKTRIGNKNFFMAGSHVAHDCVVGNSCILANNALVAGHCVLEDGVYLSGNTAVHQFVRLGRLSLLSGNSAMGMDLPPFFIAQGHNSVGGVNIIGMRRAGLLASQINAVRQAFQIIYRGGLLLPQAVSRIEEEFGAVEPVVELLNFLKQSKRGIALRMRHAVDEAA